MPDSAILDVPIGLILVFAIGSVAVSRINEVVFGVMAYRGRQLETELRRLFGDGPVDRTGTTPDTSLTAQLLDGSLRGLRTGGRRNAVPDLRDALGQTGAWRRARQLRLPSYIPSTAFARGVLDMLEPPVRVLLSRMDTAALPDSARDAYRDAHHSLTDTTAAALAEAITAAPSASEENRKLAISIAGLAGPESVRPLLEELDKLPENAPLRLALTGIATRAGHDRDRIVAEIAAWYDDTMDRLSGWYKRRVQRFLIVYALLVTLALNLDAIALTNALWENRSLRAAVVEAAVTQVNSAPVSTGTTVTSADTPTTNNSEDAANQAVQAIRDAGALHLPLGWTDAGSDSADPRAVPDDVGGWALKILGWLFTTLALSLGAPFWFDLLGRLVNMRSTGPKPVPIA
ncbi:MULTISPECIES: hypothetical protein [Protofrankia]|uniref:Uncharacterized protein n=1 Tax=Candidatus Protofrankia datiscae TaxID=2716812 RepID=F8AX69_9ACTN|nr:MULTISPECIES: hypothetical protein [Protofrankia]AEH08418.1 hypothetical protein FsymDg_0912 [Candidatus Protofrankia datiscae]